LACTDDRLTAIAAVLETTSQVGHRQYPARDRPAFAVDVVARATLDDIRSFAGRLGT
jgi:hypothetical protein